ncbi:MAG: CcdB family protein [Rhodobacteraceae bacterium]|nr:CcdB family protein [Paracoccaceae bacterium]MCZ8154347.1 CcdB family protein [Paracoccaceae bacterium]
MADQFDLYRMAEGDYVVVLQSDLLDDLNTRAVCLAIPEGAAVPALPALSPVLTAGDIRLRLAPHVLATLTLAELGTFVANLAHERDRIIRAFDLMLTGA